MWGAIAGDIIGSVYEHRPIKRVDFPLFQRHSRFTDDTVLTIATADALLKERDYASAYHELGGQYPRAGYGGSFQEWLASSSPKPYGSWGNGSAMRVSPIGLAFHTPEEVLEEARRSAGVTHDHREGVKGAQAVALAILLAREGASKREIRRRLENRFSYNLTRTIKEIRTTYVFDVSCQGSVPEAITAFLEAEDWEEAVRLAISLGGDADTQASIAGAIAEAFHRSVPPEIVSEVRRRLTPDLLAIADEFRKRHGFELGIS